MGPNMLLELLQLLDVLGILVDITPPVVIGIEDTLIPDTHDIVTMGAMIMLNKGTELENKLLRNMLRTRIRFVDILIKSRNQIITGLAMAGSTGAVIKNHIIAVLAVDPMIPNHRLILLTIQHQHDNIVTLESIPLDLASPTANNPIVTRERIGCTVIEPHHITLRIGAMVPNTIQAIVRRTIVNRGIRREHIVALPIVLPRKPINWSLKIAHFIAIFVDICIHVSMNKIIFFILVSSKS